MYALFPLLALAGILLVLVLLIAVLSAVVRNRSRSVHDGPGGASVAERAIQGARLRTTAAVLFSMGVLIGLVAIGFATPQFLGIPFAVAPGLAASGGLLLFAATPPTQMPRTKRNTASLTPRDPWSFGSRRDFTILLVSAATLIVFLVGAGLAASLDDNGLSRTFSIVRSNMSGSSSPYPGWFYGVPLIVVTVILAASTLAALSRIATTPSLPSPELQNLDAQWRTVSTRVVARLGTAALLGYFGGTAFFAGLAMRSAAITVGLNGEPAPVEQAVGVSLLVLSPVLLVTGIVFLVLASINAATLAARPQAVSVSPVAEHA